MDFNIYGSKFRPIGEKTYSIKFGIEYSRFWNTVKIRFGKNKSKAKNAPNGINYNNFISYYFSKIKLAWKF